MQAILRQMPGAKILILLPVLLLVGYVLLSADLNQLHDFSIIVIGIILQAFPFLLIGTLVSSVIGVYVSDEHLIKLFPKQGLKATLSAIGMGVILPLCDCAVIPVAARLRKKGVPLHAVVTFMMAAPIVNPVVILSTIYAFPGTQIAFYRVIAGVVIAVATGFILRMFYGKEPDEALYSDTKIEACHDCGEEVSEPHACCDHHAHATHAHTTPSLQKIIAALQHAGEEFIQVGRLFIIGVMLTAAIQVFVPKAWSSDFAGNNFSAIFVMMTLSFVMSICSTSDAFIARNFLSSVPLSGVFGFVVFGPVLDLKNAIILSGYFKKKFVVEFVAIAFAVAFIVVTIFSALFLKTGGNW